MKKVYPIVLIPAELGYVVYVPDLQINTEGDDIVDAINMARDAIGLWGITEEDCGRKIPEPVTISLESIGHEDNEIVTLVDMCLFRGSAPPYLIFQETGVERLLFFAIC